MSKNSKHKEKRGSKMEGILQPLSEGDNVRDEVKAGTSGTRSPGSASTIVSVSSAEKACTPETKLLGKRSRASTFPGVTSSASSSGSKPPPQSRRKLEAKPSRRRMSFPSEDDTNEESNLDSDVEASKNKAKLLDRQSRRERREKMAAEMELVDEAKREAKNLDTADVLNRCLTLDGCRDLEVHKLGNIVREMISEADNIRRKSRNIQGPLSGRMKDCLEKSMYVIQNILDRAQDRGDLAYLRAQNVELTTKLRVALSNEEKHRREIEALNKEISYLKASAKTTAGAAVSAEPRVVLSRLDLDGVSAEVLPGSSSSLSSQLLRRQTESRKLDVVPETKKGRVVP